MRSFIRSLMMITLSLVLIAPLAFSATYTFYLDVHSLATEQLINSPKIVEASPLSINGVKMKTFNTTFENPKEATVLSFRAKALRSKLKAEFLKKFDLYGMPNGNVFVPHGWKLIYANLGKDDALTYTFAPEGKKGYLTFTHIATCKQCALNEASLFFEQHKPYYSDSNLPLQIVKIKPTLVAYGTSKDGYRIEGVANYEPNRAQSFWKIEVALPEEDIRLANPLLNQFITLYE